MDSLERILLMRKVSRERVLLDPGGAPSPEEPTGSSMDLRRRRIAPSSLSARPRKPSLNRLHSSNADRDLGVDRKQSALISRQKASRRIGTRRDA
jgi:hypothetical protein